ncbi:hypothetical protein EBU99_01530 [bacterium]|nr:hypothetical protein [bacterium]
MSEHTTPRRDALMPAVNLSFACVALLCPIVGCVTPSAGKNAELSGSAGQTAAHLPQNILFNGGPTVPRAEAGQGLAWFPFVWSPQLASPEKESGLTAIDTLFIREPKLVLRNTATNAETLLSLRDESASDKPRVELSQKEGQKSTHFYLPRLLLLAPGDYVIESIRLEIGSLGQEHGMQVNMPFVNPFQASASKNLTLAVREGQIATIARVVQTTSLAQAAQGLSLKSSSESLDRDVVPVDLVLSQFNRTGVESFSQVRAGTSDFPRLRFNLTDENGVSRPFEEAKANVGFLVDAPCSAEGVLRMVWKRQNDEREFMTHFPIKPKTADCHAKQSLAYSFALPNGDWMIKSSLIAPANNFQPEIQTAWLRAPAPILKDYFALAQPAFRWSLETSKEREIRRPLMVQVESLSRRFAELRSQTDFYRGIGSASSPKILFLGHFEIRLFEAKNDRAAVWETLLKPSFDLNTAQALLGSKDIFNAYTLERLVRSRSLKVNTVMRTASDQDDLPAVKPIAAEFRGEAAKAYTVCLHEREEADPLVNLGGELRFTVLKGGNSVTMKKLKMGSEGLSDKWVESCLEKKLMRFRFSRKAPANFQGELKFSAE